MGRFWYNRGLPFIGSGPSLPYSESFEYPDGSFPSRWLGGSTWQIVSGKAVNTPTLGDEQNTNPGFDADTDWTKGTNWTIGSGVASSSGSNDGFSLTQLTGPASGIGTWYRLAANIVRSAGAYLLGTGNWLGVSLSTTGAKVQTGRSIATTKARIYSSNFVGTVDNLSSKALTLASLFQAINAGTPNVDVSAAATIVAGTQAGVVVNLDSVASPANFVVGYHDGTTAKLEKCVAGTYTTLISVAATYVAGATVRVVKSGTNVSLYYNGSQVGTTQTVSDAGIISNNYHGLFSSYEGNTLDTFTVTAV